MCSNHDPFISTVLILQPTLNNQQVAGTLTRARSWSQPFSTGPKCRRSTCNDLVACVSVYTIFQILVVLHTRASPSTAAAVKYRTDTVYCHTEHIHISSIRACKQAAGLPPQIFTTSACISLPSARPLPSARRALGREAPAQVPLDDGKREEQDVEEQRQVEAPEQLHAEAGGRHDEPHGLV